MLVKGYLTLKTIVGISENTKMIKVMNLVVDATSMYNGIIGAPLLTS